MSPLVPRFLLPLLIFAYALEPFIRWPMFQKHRKAILQFFSFAKKGEWYY